MRQYIDWADIGSYHHKSIKNKWKRFSRRWFLYLPFLALANCFDSFLDTAVDQLVLHALLDQLDQLFAHLVAGQWVSDGGNE